MREAFGLHAVTREDDVINVRRLAADHFHVAKVKARDRSVRLRPLMQQVTLRDQHQRIAPAK